MSHPQPLPDDIPHSEAIQDPNLGATGVNLTQNGSTAPFNDIFFGPRDKKYLDFLARRITKLRGTNCFYYVLQSQTERLDGITPVSKSEAAGPFDSVRHAGDSRGIAAMYGEPIIVGQRISAVEREVIPAWEYAEPIAVRGVLTEPERAETPDDRGSIFTNRIRIHLARVLCEETWKIRPRVGDVVRIPGGITNPGLDRDYYDVEEVVVNNSRFGATGFFTTYTLQLARSSRFIPERKLPEKDQRPSPDPRV